MKYTCVIAYISVYVYIWFNIYIYIYIMVYVFEHLIAEVASSMKLGSCKIGILALGRRCRHVVDPEPADAGCFV